MGSGSRVRVGKDEWWIQGQDGWDGQWIQGQGGRGWTVDPESGWAGMGGGSKVRVGGGGRWIQDQGGRGWAVDPGSGWRERVARRAGGTLIRNKGLRGGTKVGPGCGWRGGKWAGRTPAVAGSGWREGVGRWDSAVSRIETKGYRDNNPKFSGSRCGGGWWKTWCPGPLWRVGCSPVTFWHCVCVCGQAPFLQK